MIEKRENILRKLKHRAKFSGSKEISYIYQQFIDKELDEFKIEELYSFLDILNLDEKSVLDWVKGVEKKSPTKNGSLLKILNKIKTIEVK